MLPERQPNTEIPTFQILLRILRGLTLSTAYLLAFRTKPPHGEAPGPVLQLMVRWAKKVMDAVYTLT